MLEGGVSTCRQEVWHEVLRGHPVNYINQGRFRLRQNEEKSFHSRPLCVYRLSRFRLSLLLSLSLSLLRCYGPFRTPKASVKVLEYVVCLALKLYTVWNNVQIVSALTITILTTTGGYCHSLNFFGHVIYAPRTSTYQNIAKPLTHTGK